MLSNNGPSIAVALMGGLHCPICSASLSNKRKRHRTLSWWFC